MASTSGLIRSLPPAAYDETMKIQVRPVNYGDAGWVRPSPPRAAIATDTGIAIALAIASPIIALLYIRTGVYGEEAEFAAPWVWAIGIGLATLPLALRRRFPASVAFATSAGFFVCGQFGVPDTLIIQISMFLALYSVGAWSKSRTVALYTRLSIIVLMLIWVVINLIVLSSDEGLFPGAPRSGIFSAFATFAAIQIITNLLYFGGAFYFGERAWRAAHTQALLAAQGRELEAERRMSAAQAVALDRLTIARELHDVVAHHISVMGIQAAAARRMQDKDPEIARQSLELVEHSAHAAVEELHGLLRTLRASEQHVPSAALGIAHLPELVAENQAAGVPTTLLVVGESRPLPMLVDVALFRVAQEALTNVRKHAGRGATAEVRLRFSEHGVEIEVSDTGVQRKLGGLASGSGLGIQGMRERIGAVGGHVLADWRESGGFLVRASVENAVSPSSV